MGFVRLAVKGVVGAFLLGASLALIAPAFSMPPGTLADTQLNFTGNFSYYDEFNHYTGEFFHTFNVSEIYGLRKVSPIDNFTSPVYVGKANVLDYDSNTTFVEAIQFRNYANTIDNITFSIENISYGGYAGSPWNITIFKDDGDGFYNDTADSIVINQGENITLSSGEVLGFYVVVSPSMDAQDLASMNFRVVVRSVNSARAGEYTGDNGLLYGGKGELSWNIKAVCHKPLIVDTYPREGQEWVPVDVIMMVKFSSKMDPSTFVASDPVSVYSDTVLLYDTARDEYVALNINTVDNQTFFFAPKERLHGLTVYRLTLKGNITSETGSVMSTDFSLTFRTLLRKDEGGVVKSGKVEVVVPPDVLFDDAIVEINSTSKIPDSFKPLKTEQVVSNVKVLFYDASERLQGDSDGDGVPDRPFKGIYTLMIDKKEESGSSVKYRAYVLTEDGWKPQKGEIANSGLKAYLNFGSHVVLVKIKMDENYIFNPYPNPFNPRKGKLAIQLKVKDFSPDAKVYIYSLDGSLVRVLDVEDPGELNVEDGLAYWDGRDESGREVATGVYVVVLVNGSEKLYKKVVVIK